jgi:hypothetical protein
MLETKESDWLSDFPPPRSLPLDQEALRVYEQAYYIGLTTEKETEPPITFSTVALALLAGQDETSRWFARLAVLYGPNAESVCQGKNTTLSALQTLQHSPGRPANPRLSSDKQLLTVSARAVLETAEEWANRVGGSDIGVRHLVASYVLNPPAAHRRQMNGWGFKERDWRTEFFAWIAGRYTAESWTDASERVAPGKAVASFERPAIKGEALAFPVDPQAQQVLERAAQYHSTRPDTWLRLQTVFFALVEEARHDVGVRQAIAPVWRAVQATEAKYQTVFDAYLPVAAIPKEIVSFDALDISPRALNGLETARELVLATHHDNSSVGVLQLAAALISHRVDCDEDLTECGLDPQALRLAVIDHAAALGEARDVWREALGEEEAAPMGRTLDLNSDEPEAVIRLDEKWTNDPLGIRSDVASFAALLASKSLEPPLSIGLFGPWGSGKTTFLKRLRRAIDDRTNQAKASQDASQQTPYVSNVVHVEFNAWHFAEDALISSLVDTIVRELRSFIKEDYPLVGAALANLKSETAERSRGKAELIRQNEAAARNAVAAAAKAVSDKKAAAQKGTVTVNAALETAWAATLAAVRELPAVRDSGVAENLGGAVKSLDELQARLEAIRSRPARLFNELGWAYTLLLAAMVLALPIATGWLINRVFEGGQTLSAIVSLSAMLSVVGVWLRAASGAVSKVDQAIAEVVKAYEKRIQSDPKVKAAQEQLEIATAAAALAAEALAVAERELQSAEAEAAAASLPTQLLTLVSNRVGDMSYSKELTTISVARGDLQKLSQILRDQVNSTSKAANLRSVDRVVLYIDDLDRCKPEDVVRVLQVVHMLLAFELFVVVVAVDARWVEESLKQNYQWLAGSRVFSVVKTGGEPAAETSARITPQDYLEKIFQISFWLEPMTAARAAEYLKSLVRTSRKESGPVVGPSADLSGTPTGPMPTEVDRVEILPIELDYMRALAAYVGPSPRRVKRLVNAYRLLKARLSDAQLRSFSTDRTTDDGLSRSGPYQLVIGLLVIGTGARTSAAHILLELAERDPRDRLDQVIDAFRERQHPDWTMSAQVLETLMRTQRSSDVSELRGWARKVGRFLLQGTPESLRKNPAP